MKDNYKEKVKVIIPAHENENYLRRSIDYWARTGIDVLVVDSSKSRYNGKTSKNISYSHTPGGSFCGKIEKALLERVDEKEYMVICAQDDFILPSGLEKCVNYLESNSKYSNCQGAAFRYEWKEGIEEINNTYSQMWLKKSEYESVIDRVRRLASPYHQLLYSVCRKGHFVKALNVCKNFRDIDRGAIMEIVFSIVLCTCGRSKFLPLPYWIRESRSQSWAWKTVNLEEWYSNSKYGDEKMRVCSDIEKETGQSGKKLLSEFYSHYVDWKKSRKESRLEYLFKQVTRKVGLRFKNLPAFINPSQSIDKMVLNNVEVGLLSLLKSSKEFGIVSSIVNEHGRCY